MTGSQSVKEKGEQFETPVLEEEVCSLSVGRGRVYSSTDPQYNAPKRSHTRSASPSQHAAYHAAAPAETYAHVPGLAK